MLTDFQKEKVRALVKAALETIEDWDPREKCELAIRAALAVANYPENEEFRDFAERYLKKEAMGTEQIQYEAQVIQSRNGGYLEIDDRLYKTWEAMRDNAKARAFLSVDHALSAIRSLKHERRMLGSYIDSSLYNAKLCAMERGEDFGLMDLIRELSDREAVKIVNDAPPWIRQEAANVVREYHNCNPDANKDDLWLVMAGAIKSIKIHELTK